MTKEELLAEEYICNGKCQDDITRNYVHCKSCTRLKDFLAGYKAGKAELEKENAELKADFIKSCKVKEQGFREAEQALERKDEHLTKAKEFIKKFSEFVNNDVEYNPEHPQEHTDLWNKLCEEAGQFLKDCDIDNAINQANKGLDFDKIADEMERDLKDSEVEK